MFIDWGVDGIMLVLMMVGCDVMLIGVWRYHGSVVDGGM